MPHLGHGLFVSVLVVTVAAYSASELPSPVSVAQAAQPPRSLSLTAAQSDVEATQPQEEPTIAVLEGIGLSRPVAATHDPTADVYLIANAAREGLPPFVTSVLPDGSVDMVRWIDASSDEVRLSSPTAMVIVRNRLVISDGRYLRVFDRETGVYRGTVDVPSATALSDLAVGDRGEIFATDTALGGSTPYGTVFRVSRRGTVSTIARSSVLGHPTGVITLGKQTWISATEPEAFYAVSRDGRLTHGATLPADGAFSGLVWADGRVVFFSPRTRTLYAGPLAGPFDPIATSVDASGDLGWDAARRRLIVPCAEGDRLEFHVLPPAP